MKINTQNENQIGLMEYKLIQTWRVYNLQHTQRVHLLLAVCLKNYVKPHLVNQYVVYELWSERVHYVHRMLACCAATTMTRYRITGPTTYSAPRIITKPTSVCKSLVEVLTLVISGMRTGLNLRRPQHGVVLSGCSLCRNGKMYRQ